MKKDIILNHNDILKLKDEVNTLKYRSKFGEGVKLYMIDILYNLQEVSDETLIFNKNNAYNGTDDALIASISGNFLVYDDDIKERLLSKSEVKKYKKSKTYHGESWLELQAYAIYLAYKKLYSMMRKNYKEI